MPNEIPPADRLSSLLQTAGIKKRFEEILSENAGSFMNSILTITNGNKKLRECDPMSIISAAAQAAILHLDITPGLGYAHIIPYKGIATFQMGWLGYVQLFLRSGQADRINALPIREGDIKRKDRLSGDIELYDEEHLANPVIGYMSWFRLRNGFQHALFMTLEQIQEHAKRYSVSYQYDLKDKKRESKWSTDFEAMALKTVTKNNLKKYAPLSAEIKKAIEVDEAIEIEPGKIEYPDAPQLPESTVTPATNLTSGRLAEAVGVPVEAPANIEEAELPL